LQFISNQKTGTDVENVSENVNEKPSLNQQKIINAIKSNKKITYTELSKLVGIAPTNVARNIKKLIETKRLIRVGPAKGRY
ncbi:MAG TPA: winged helix-turn-helix domain-containing protein, partial [Niabella sp.]|nr:winged helix-turn-helix domain-containing protein [Niabella sp.]